MNGMKRILTVLIVCAALLLCACNDADTGGTTTAAQKPDAPTAGVCEHTFGNGVKVKFPTCTETGLEARVCSKCGHTETFDVRELGHEEVPHAGQAPGCTTDGWRDYVTCTRCPYSTYQTVAATHDPANLDPACDACLAEMGSVGLEYTLNERGDAYTVTGVGSARESAISVLAVYYGKPVTAIAGGAFADCLTLERILIPASVTQIGEGVFAGCTSLSSVVIDSENPAYRMVNGCLIDLDQKKLLYGNAGSVIPDDGSVISIGSLAFDGCTALTRVVIPTCIKSVASDAFEGCVGIADVEAPTWALPALPNGNLRFLKINGGSEIAAHTFSNCVQLERVVLCDAVIMVGDMAFYGCSSLSELTLSPSTVHVSPTAFVGCYALRTAQIPVAALSCVPITGLQTLVINGGKSLDADALKGCSSLTSLAVSESVTEVHKTALSDCVNVTQALIPVSCAGYLPTGALVTLEIYGSGIVPDSAFKQCSTLRRVTVGAGVTALGNQVFRECRSLETVTLRGVVTIGDQVFQLCTSLVDVTLEGNVTSIGQRAFDGCEALAVFRFPKTLVTLGAYAFEDCAALGAIDLPEGLEEIGNSAFFGCSALTEVTIPASVKSIGLYVFECCGGLESITVAEGNTFYRSAGNCLINTTRQSVLAGCKNSVIPDDGSVTRIDSSAFSGCTGLVSMTIPATIKFMGTGIFQACPNLESLTVAPGNPTYHSDGNCIIKTETKTLVETCKNSVIPTDGSVTVIGPLAFAQRDYLDHFVVPSFITELGSRAFFRGPLKSIVVHAGVTALNNYVLAWCYSLEAVYYEGSTEEWTALVGDFRVFGSDIGGNISQKVMFYYSEEPPTTDGNFWHYDANGTPTKW